jgi:hypothetical protein
MSLIHSLSDHAAILLSTEGPVRVRPHVTVGAASGDFEEILVIW